MGKQSVMSKSRTRSEAEIKKSVMDYLKARGIMAFRMNSGTILGASKGKTWAVRLNPAGTADILAILSLSSTWSSYHVVWIECKREGGKQSPAQKEFQKMVEAEGHRYMLVRSAAELAEML